jgi:UDP-N-acetylglucosamine--N-acetylmuramyl-(pentapeptide) pyrophosphoryl-undecaprenol N-acetylglucosamine transferase
MTGLRAILAGGGTGGHLFPGLAVAEEIHRRGGDALFVGTARGLETRVLPAEGWPLELIRVQGLIRTGWRQRFRFLREAPGTVWQVLRLLHRHRPQVVVGVGGYASGPVVLTASGRRLPTAILEQNSIPGITNRILGRIATEVYATFEQSRRWFPRRRVSVLGNPVRRSIVESLQGLELPAPRVDGRVRLLAFGGSQGARFLNETLMEAAPRLAAEKVSLVHQTGEADHARVCEAYREAGYEAEVLPFIEDMAPRYAAADLVLCRAGATTLAELAIAGRPAVLVPFPFATHDHQTANARVLERRGAALCRAQHQLDGPTLADLVLELARDPARRARMADAMRSAARPEAAAAVVDRLERLVAAARRRGR